ncbi:MAG: hypothetical protein AAGJ46_05360 [Planctomycetota bacterium]
MANLIFENSPEIAWYTDLYPFFSQIPGAIGGYDWLWTDVELNCALPLPESADGSYWLSGEELWRFVQSRPQFIWSVLSAIPREKRAEAEACDAWPYADGNGSLWLGSPTPQHPYADFEIVCWDSGATLLINGDEQFSKAFRQAYPGAADLRAD